MVRRAWFRLLASGLPFTSAALAGLACIVAAAWVIWPVAGLAALGATLFLVGVYGPDGPAK